MVRYVFALEPSKEIYLPLLDFKKKLAKEIKDADYLLDPPHLTLFIGEFDESVLSDLDDFFPYSKKITLSRNIMTLNTFNEDPVTKKKTVFFKITEENSLKELQLSLIRFLNPKNIQNSFSRYSSEIFSINPVFKSNLEEYGYPFVGDIWIPHISVGSFGEKYPLEEIESFFNRQKSSSFCFDKLIIYELREDDSLIERKTVYLKERNQLKVRRL